MEVEKLYIWDDRATVGVPNLVHHYQFIQTKHIFSAHANLYNAEIYDKLSQ